MTLAIRFLTTKVLHHPSGRTYGTGATTTTDVPLADGLAIGDDQGTVLCYVGATTDRPLPDRNRLGWPPPAMYDTTLAKMVFWRNNGWVDVTGAAA
jgi:hypothetical protein